MTHDELKDLLEANAAASIRQFNETADRLSGENRHFFELATDELRHQIQLIAEGVSATRETLSREAADNREEIRRGFTETQAMIKFSHAELDRRVLALEESRRAVEQTLHEVQARLDRLESTH